MFQYCGSQFQTCPTSTSCLMKFTHFYLRSIFNIVFTDGSQSEEDKSQPKTVNERCLADELQEALLKSDSVEDDVFLPNELPTAKQCPDNSKIYPKFSGRYLDELRSLQFSNSVSKNTKAYLNSNNIYLEEDSSVETRHPSVASASGRDGREFDGNYMELYDIHFRVLVYRNMHFWTG